MNQTDDYFIRGYRTTHPAAPYLSYVSQLSGIFVSLLPPRNFSVSIQPVFSRECLGLSLNLCILFYWDLGVKRSSHLAQSHYPKLITFLFFKWRRDG